MAYVPSELLKCVVFLGYLDSRGKTRTAGSGFWISRPGPKDIRNEWRPSYLITAAHVIDDIKRKVSDKRVWLRVNRKNGSPSWQDTPVACWRTHPDACVDIAVMKMGIDKDLDHLAWPTEWFVSERSMEDDDRRIELGDELFFAGLFWPHKGEIKNVPIVRMGNVAALRGEPVLNRHGQPMDAYLVESRSIGGLSGSPVFIDIHAAKQVYGGERGFISGEFPAKFRLVGVVHGHFGLSDSEPDAAYHSAEKVDINMGVAIVTPSDKIGAVLDQYGKEEEEEAETYRNKRFSARASVMQGTNATIRKLD